jgi:hypothetical protein
MKPTPGQHLYDIINQRMEEEIKTTLPHLSLRQDCLATDPHRGVSCHLPRGHEGDHASVAGFPWENEHNPRPKYQGASAGDLAAVEELLRVPEAVPYVKGYAHHAFTTLSGSLTCNWRPAPWRGGDPENQGAVCGLSREDPIHEDRCDDCGMKWPAHDMSVEH